MASERIRFPGAFGDQLAARVDRPDGTPRAWALFAHCFTCSKDLKAVSRISRALNERGFGVFRFDFTGLGESEGDFADTNFSSNLDDLFAAIAWLREHEAAPELLIGHSLGGAAVLTVAGEIDEVKAVATIGAPSNTSHIRDTLLDAAPELDQGDADSAEVELAGRTFRVKRQFIEDLSQERVLDAVAKLARPLLIFHSPIDGVVSVDHARKIYVAAKHPKSYVSLDDADHLLLRNADDAVYLADVLSAWASRYLSAAPAGESTATESASADPVPRGTVRVVAGPEGLRHEVRAGAHQFFGDEPTSVPGGTDTGPTPYDLLLAALGTCTTMTLRLYANRKKWDLQGVEVTLRHGRVHADDCDDCEKDTGHIDEITKEMVFHGDLDDTQRARLLDISTRCPVHRTLLNEIKIRSELG
ncbi:MAG: alpha/beta fold hydrolase [Acidobacteriota bacterium]